MKGALLVGLMVSGLAMGAGAEPPASLCQLYQQRAQQQWARFDSLQRDLGADEERWQWALWQDLAALAEECPGVTVAESDALCRLGRHLLGAQRAALEERSWPRSSTGEEASLVLEVGDRVDAVCRAPVMAVQGVLQRMQSPLTGTATLGPDPLGFNPQAWLFVPSGSKGVSSSTKN